MSMKRVPLIKPDLPPLDEVHSRFEGILKSGRITNFGEYVQEFEARAGSYLGTTCVSTSSATMGLVFTLNALGLKPGERVLMPSFTFNATAQAILYAGGVPQYVDVDDDLNVSLADLEDQLAKYPDVRVVIPVHIYGLPARVDEIKHLVDAAAARYGHPISILYDAAHAFGSTLDGRRVGQFGDAEVFSLSVTKVLVSVEGGMVSTNDLELVDRLKKMRNYGIEANYNSRYPGLNGKMSEFHAIVGLYNLNRIDELLTERQSKARLYLNEIHEATGFETLPWPEGVTHTFKDFTILVPEEFIDRRDRVMAFLGERGIETRAYFHPPIHEQDMFKAYADRALPKTEALSRRVISLPFYTTIGEDDIRYVVDALVDAERSVLKA